MWLKLSKFPWLPARLLSHFSRLVYEERKQTPFLAQLFLAQCQSFKPHFDRWTWKPDCWLSSWPLKWSLVRRLCFHVTAEHFCPVINLNILFLSLGRIDRPGVGEINPPTDLQLYFCAPPPILHLIDWRAAVMSWGTKEASEGWCS